MLDDDVISVLTRLRISGVWSDLPVADEATLPSDDARARQGIKVNRPWIGPKHASDPYVGPFGTVGPLVVGETPQGGGLQNRNARFDSWVPRSALQRGILHSSAGFGTAQPSPVRRSRPLDTARRGVGLSPQCGSSLAIAGGGLETTGDSREVRIIRERHEVAPKQLPALPEAIELPPYVERLPQERPQTPWPARTTGPDRARGLRPRALKGGATLQIS